MTAPDHDKAFLQVCLAKRLIDKTQAKEVWQAAQEAHTTPQAVLIERGLMAAHTVAALEKEMKRAEEPRTIGGFRLIKPLGQGGMATVFLAQQISLGREVALKLMSQLIASDKDATERFLREARTAAVVNHPNVVSIIDVGQADGQLYMALELVTGGDAAKLAERFGGSLPEARALELLIDCAKGLQALYEARLVHRDLKPSNIFITGDGVAKLGDLGLARSEDGADRMTVTGHLVGTPAFMSPEQAGGEGTVDIRSDIYSLGATLFALVTGRQPFIGKGPIAVAAKALTEPTPDPRVLAPHLTTTTAHLIQRAMAKKPAERFQTPRDLREALEQALGLTVPGENRTATRTSTATFYKPTDLVTPATVPGRRFTTSRTYTRRRSKQPPWVVLAVIAALVVALIPFMVAQGRTPDPVGSSAQTTPAVVEPTRPASAEQPQSSGTSTKNPPAVTPPAKLPPVAVAAPPVPALPASATAAPPIGDDPPQVTWASAQGRDAFGHWLTITVGGVAQRLRWMPPGTSVVGSPPDEAGRFAGNEAQSTVTFTFGVWLADTETTQAFWQAVTGSNPSAPPLQDNLPVNRISVAEAIAFTRALRTKLGGARVRLPSRAEWERACRAGTTTAHYTGDDARSLQGHANVFDRDRLANVHQGKSIPINDGFVGLAPVGSFTPNRWGFFDLHGNVCEYCLGQPHSLPPTCTDPLIDDGPDGQFGYIRGGAYASDGLHAYRAAAHPYVGRDAHNDDTGMRFLIEAPR